MPRNFAAMASIGTLSPNPWVRVLDALEKKVNRSSYETWLKPTRFSHSQGAVLFVRVPNPDFCHIGEKVGRSHQRSHRRPRPRVPGRRVRHRSGKTDRRAQTSKQAEAANRRCCPMRKRPRLRPRRNSTAAFRLGWSGTIESQIYLRRIRYRRRKPVRSRRFTRGGRTSFESL